MMVRYNVLLCVMCFAAGAVLFYYLWASHEDHHQGTKSTLFASWRSAGHEDTSHQHVPDATNTHHATKNTSQLPRDLANVDQRNFDLIEHIRQRWLVPPSTKPRNLVDPSKMYYSQRGQSKFIDNLLKNRTNGVFIEAGAYDGEAFSNSLFFELSRNWSGLLVEANPDLFRKLSDKNRHAYLSNVCLSPEKKPTLLEFKPMQAIGGLVGYMDELHKARIQKESNDPNLPSIDVQCLPLYSLLKAAGIKHVDYLSLDIEGAELEILQTFPFDEIRVDVLSVEYMTQSNEGSLVKKQKIKELLVGKYGYREVPFCSGCEDIILVKDS